MPLLTTACPNNDRLKEFVLGRLPKNDMDLLAEHVEGCSACVSELTVLRASDTLLDSLQGTAVTEKPDPKVSELIERLIRQAPQISGRTTEFPASQSFQLNADETNPSIAEEEDSYDFLAPAQSPDEIGRLGGYRILKVLGTGGMGVVFLVEDPHLKRTLALKTMKPAVAAKPGHRQRFIREAQLAARLESDHIVPIFQVGEDRGIPFLAMPFLKGASLEDLLKKEPVFDVAKAVRLAIQSARGLAVAHAAGLIHRDIKPANLWVEPEGGGRVKILDFGLARMQEDTSMTQSGAIMGTPAYMSPEQARGEKVDARCDLFSLGCVLYRMLTGAQPFRGVDTMSTLLALAMNDPTPPSEMNPNVPHALSDFVMRLMEKDHAKRPATARIVEQELSRMEQPSTRTGSVAVGSDSTNIDPWQNLDEVTPKAKPSTREAKKKRGAKHKTGPLVALAAAILLLVVGCGFAAYKLVFETKDGSLIVVISDRETEARFKNGELQLLDTNGKVKYTIKPSDQNTAVAPGEYKVTVKGADGLELDTTAFEMKKGGQVTVRVAADSKKVAVAPSKIARKDDEAWIVRRHDGAVVRGVAFSSDGKWVVSGSVDKTARLWDVETGKELACFRGHTDEVSCVAISPDRRFVASQGWNDDSTVRVWDIATRKEVHRFMHGRSGCGVCFSPDSKRILSSSFDGNLRIWELKTEELVAKLPINTWLLRVAYSPDGKTVLGGVWDGSAQLWDVESKRLIHRMAGAKGIVESVDYSSDGKYLLSTGADDGTIRMWDSKSGKPLHTFSLDSTRLEAATFSPNSDYILSGHTDKAVRLWDVKTQQVIHTFRHHNGPVASVAFSPDGRRAVSASLDFHSAPGT